MSRRLLSCQGGYCSFSRRFQRGSPVPSVEEAEQHIYNTLLSMEHTHNYCSCKQQIYICLTQGTYLYWTKCIYLLRTTQMLLLFDYNKIKMVMKPGKQQKENQVECTRESKIWKLYRREGSREGNTGTVMELNFELRWPL